MTKSPKPLTWPAVILGLVALFACARLAWGQSSEDQKLLYDSIAKVESGDFAAVHVETIVKFHAVQAIPALEEQFTRSKDDEMKAHIGSALVRLGDKHDASWRFLIDYATKALDSDPPDIASTPDAQGNPSREPPPQVVQWAKDHHLSMDAAGDELIFRIPGAIFMLGITGDARAVPVLRRALKSHDSMVQVVAARGLALAKDKDSIPAIIEACRKAIPEAAQTIALALIYFDDPDAQKAADEFLPKDAARAEREKRMQGRNPFQ